VSSKDFDDLVKGIENENGIFFLSGHFSNWELIAFSFPVITGYSLNIITKKQASKKLNLLINKFRSLSGNKMIETGMTLKEALRVVKQKKPVCFLVDQAGHPDYSVYSEFFGMNVASFVGPAKLALAERPELIFAFMVRQPNFEFRVHSNHIYYDDLNDKSKESLEILTQRIQSEVEKAIREYPEQWLWFHKRFKHSRS
jgi:KDO2-lipid IV(A) lauroyltransferase